MQQLLEESHKKMLFKKTMQNLLKFMTSKKGVIFSIFTIITFFTLGILLTSYKEKTSTDQTIIKQEIITPNNSTNGTTAIISTENTNSSPWYESLDYSYVIIFVLIGIAGYAYYVLKYDNNQKPDNLPSTNTDSNASIAKPPNSTTDSNTTIAEPSNSIISQLSELSDAANLAENDTSDFLNQLDDKEIEIYKQMEKLKEAVDNHFEASLVYEMRNALLELIVDFGKYKEANTDMCKLYFHRISEISDAMMGIIQTLRDMGLV